MWTDVLQAVVLAGGLIAIVITGVKEYGSFGEVWDTAVRHGRAGPEAFK